MPLDPLKLPNVALLRQRAQGLAMLDAIVCEDWEGRYYSYNSKWCPGQEMASMRNGQGDEWFLKFGAFGAGIKGLAHETALAGDAELLGMTRASVPSEFQPFLDEPAFNWNWMSFCYWRGPSEASWHRVVHPDENKAELDDGSEELLSLLFESANAYVNFASWYYEIEIPEELVEAVYRQVPLSNELVRAINPDRSLDDLAAELDEIGYGLSQQ